MLNGKLALHDIHDVEAFCTTIAKGRNRQHNHHEQEDLIAWLIEECWILSTRYQPGGITFSTWARTTLQKRVHDHIRQRDGRTTWKFKNHTHTRTRPHLVSLDNPTWMDGRDEEARTTIGLDYYSRAGLGHSVTGQPLDPEIHRSPDLMRLLRTRDRTRPRPDNTMGQRTPRAAA